MVTKILGYILALAGAVGLLYGFLEPLKKLVPLPETFPELYITIGSGALIIVGIILVLKGGEPISAELPIYSGNQVIGYRRN